MADDDLPVKLTPATNGEFVPPPATPVVRETVRRARRDAEDLARRLGWSRRDFLRSSMAAALTLGTLAACSREAGDGSPSGTFAVDPDATTDPDLAVDALSGDEFVMDVQTHFLDASHDLGMADPGFPQSRCGEDDPLDCYSTERFLDLILNQSDTDILVLSALPFSGNPMSPEVMARTMAFVDEHCQDGVVLMQGESHPSDGSIERVLANLADLNARFPIAAWKVYTHLGGPGWWLDDADADAPQVGTAFLDGVRATMADGGPGVVAVHKGLSGGARFASPRDVGPAAARHPDLTFVVYHSGYETNHTEGPYVDGATDGVDGLITSLREAGVGPGGNVVAELGSTWRALMAKPDEAAHVLGKLLTHLGPDNVVWGTDSIWYGSPQDQLQAFRSFEITEQARERFGYPALTPAVKANILGATSARLYGVEPVRRTCRLDAATLEDARLAAVTTDRVHRPTQRI